MSNKPKARLPGKKTKPVAASPKGTMPLVSDIASAEQLAGKKRVLSLQYSKNDYLHPIFQKEQEWHREIYDAARLSGLSSLPEGEYDAVWSAHHLVHHYAHETQAILKQLHRVIRPDGFLLLAVPNLHKICENLVKNGTAPGLVKSGNHMLTALDLLYGDNNVIAHDQRFAHRTGFTAKLLATAMKTAGFTNILVQVKDYFLWARGEKLPLAESQDVIIRIDEPDINKIIRARDEIDQEPQIWKGFPPQA